MAKSSGEQRLFAILQVRGFDYHRKPGIFSYQLDLDIIIFIYISIHTKLLLIRSLHNFLYMF